MRIRSPEPRIVAVGLLLLLLGSARAQDSEQLTRHLPRLAERMRCVTERGACDEAGNELRGFLIKGLKFDCRKCTTEQKVNFKTLIAYIKDKFPDNWKIIEKQYSRPKI